MADSPKLPITIYEIEREQFEKLNDEDIVGEIARRLRENDLDLAEMRLNNRNVEEFTVSLYSFSKVYPPTWLKFVAPIIDKDDLLLKSRNKVFSFIGFIAYKTRIYAIAGGYGSFEVEQFTKPDLGLEIIVKLFDRDSRVIKSIQQRGVTGVVLGQTRFYRGDQRFSDENQFGQIFRQVQAELDSKHLIKSFGFLKDDLRRETAGCIAKSSFKINKAINFDELLTLIKRIDGILGRRSKFALNKVVHLRGRRFEKLVNDLNEEMCKQIFNDYEAGKVPDFEICHSKFEQYLTAENYILELSNKECGKYYHRPSWQKIIKDIKDKKFLEDEDETYFKHSVLFRKLASYDAEGNRVTYDTLFDHLNGELLHKGDSFFHIDKGWYRIDPTFIDDLNTQCESMLKDDVWDIDTIKNKFDVNEDENVFNQSYLGMKGCLVLDTVTPENIECCDILMYNSDRVTFVHVKKGFSNAMRDLTAQVSIAAKRIRETIYSDYKYFEKVEEMAKTSAKKDPLRTAIAAQPFPPKGIANLFKQTPRPKITFCLAFVDTATSKRSLLSDMSKFGSNIAKYSLIELAQDLRLMGFDFKVVQIQKQA